MPYAHRPMHDADAHVMETGDWLRQHADPAVREKLPPIHLASVKPGEEQLIERFRAKHQDPDYRADDEAKLMLRKNWAATGSFVSVLVLVGVDGVVTEGPEYTGAIEDQGGRLQITPHRRPAQQRAPVKS